MGGVRTDLEGRTNVPGLYAAGEPMGEIFYYNYPGASSVIRGAVYGKIAGADAAARVRA